MADEIVEGAVAVEGAVESPAVETPAVEKAVRKQWGALEFAQLFNRCEDAAEVAKLTGMSVAGVHSKASGLRKKGITIKNLKRGGGKGRAKLDIEAINAQLNASNVPADSEKTETPAT